MKRPVLFLACAVMASCGFNPNIPNQTTTQSLAGRMLLVGFFESPIAEGIRVQDPNARPLTEDDLTLALQAAQAHCAEFGQSLAPVAGVFYPAEASFLFGRCVE